MLELNNISYNEKGLKNLSNILSPKNYSSVFVLVDTNTKEKCLNRFVRISKIENATVLTMAAGEENKNLKTCEALWNELSFLGADRDSALINLGGGVVTDLGAFVACTFKRGIDFYNIPTTLLSMVDASVGGKTGIDLGSLKNQIGTIQEPQEVIIDSDWLSTLPSKEIRSGFAEMLKHGLIASPDYWNSLKIIKKLTPPVLSDYIKTSIKLKSEVVTLDPKEKGLRKVLNFGHTLGHAIESYFLASPSRKRLLHGEAIAIGMVLEAYLSVHCCGLQIEEANDIKTTFSNHYGIVIISAIEQNEIIALLRHDKKNKAGRINFSLLKSIGIPKIDIEVPQEYFSKAFQYYLNT
jgi:3-dehydroquinate synthase